MGRRKQPQITVVATRGRKVRQDIYVLAQLQVGDDETANADNAQTFPDRVLLQNPHADWLFFTHFDCIYADEMPNVDPCVGYLAAVNLIDQGADVWCGLNVQW